MTEQATLCMMALTRVPGIGLPGLRLLLEQAGSATVIYEHRRHIRDVMPELHPRAVEGISLMDTLMGRAEEEYRFASQSRIRCLGFYDDDYPARLRECSDAPILLYFRGTADLNARRVVSMVGTRKITPYGRDLCARFVADLRALSPDTLVVSGLAYGVDIHCHRAALAQGLPTVGVLAHGMDQIYPRMHRTDAVKMLEQGGLLTEFMSQTNADKKNFVQRNRIVAGMSDATIVVESARKGGSLITAQSDSHESGRAAHQCRGLPAVYGVGDRCGTPEAVGPGCAAGPFPFVECRREGGGGCPAWQRGHANERPHRAHRHLHRSAFQLVVRIGDAGRGEDAEWWSV